PFACRGGRRATRDFAFAELDVDRDFGVFARRAGEGRCRLVRTGFRTFRDRYVGRQRVDFEFDLVASAFAVADAALLGRVGRDLVVAGWRPFRHSCDLPFACRGGRLAARDFAFAELDVDCDFGVFARRPFEGRFGVAGAGFGAFGDRDVGRQRVDFEAHRRFALAFEVADAALLDRKGVV